MVASRCADRRPGVGRTRYSGGSGAPGGLTRQGRELVAAMCERGVVLDASHLAEEAFWDALEIGRMRSSPRTRTPGRSCRATSPWRAYERLAAQLLIGSIQPHELVCVLADEHSTPDAVRFEAEVGDIVNQRLERLAVTSVCRLDSRAAVPLQIVDLLTAAVAFEFRQQLGLAGAHSPKADLARYVRDAFSVSSFLKGVDRSGV